MTEPSLLTAVCATCRTVKPVEDFPPSKRGGRRASDGYPQSWYCRACLSEDAMARWRTKRDWVNAYKLERGCADCGYRERAIALQFDHLPGTVKRAKVADLLASAPMEVILAEIALCEVVCANCHAIRTQDRAQANGWRLVTPGAKVLLREIPKDPQQSFDF